MFCIQCQKVLKCDRKTTRQSKFCSIQCQRDNAYHEYIKRWLNDLEDGMRGQALMSKYIRRWLFEQRGELCWECGWNVKHSISGKCPLEVDHIDGSHTNNHHSNLRLLCPNCHSLTSTYKNRNKGRGRHYRRERYHNGQSY